MTTTDHHRSERSLRVVAIETSDRCGSVAAMRVVGGEEKLLHAIELSPGQRSAQSLAPTLQQLWKTCDWQPHQIDLVAVTSGPGSFTGLRIGVTTAKTLAYACGASLAAVHTLSAMAAGVESCAGRLWTVLDAQRGELFAACFPLGEPSHLPETQVLPVAEWLLQLEPGDVVSGPPLGKLAGELPPGVAAAPESNWVPQASAVARLGLAAYLRGDVTDPIQLVPQYYRRSAAEEKAQARE